MIELNETFSHALDLMEKTDKEIKKYIEKQETKIIYIGKNK